MCTKKNEDYRCKRICAKLQEAGLRASLEELNSIKYNTPRNDTVQILDSIYSILEEYDCEVCESLKNRIARLAIYIGQNSNKDYTTFGGISAINILAREIEVFLQINSES